jgi:retron-type reverse transcriptase
LGDGYVLMMDFKGYFDNILHEPIYESLEKKFTDKGVRDLTRQFIEPFGSKSLGLGSQVSQIWQCITRTRLTTDQARAQDQVLRPIHG